MGANLKYQKEPNNMEFYGKRKYNPFVLNCRLYLLKGTVNEIVDYIFLKGL